MNPGGGLGERRHDLDWLRIIAFALLILYHVGMFYVSWDWHVKSSRASEWLEPLMLLTNPWRLTLLFLVAGAATRFMADKTQPAQLARSRMRRLWPPLLLAVFVVVPPQAYYEVVEALQQIPERGPEHEQWLDGFYFKYLTASGNWCDADGCLITPTYNHMWFVAYLIIYTLALVALLPLLRRLPAALGWLIAGPGLIFTPWAVMFALRMGLFPVFGETHAFWNDAYLHALYFTAFLFGFGVARHAPFFEGCARWRWAALATALLAWITLLYVYAALPEDVRPGRGTLALLRGTRELQAWMTIVAMIGFAYRWLRDADGPVKRLLTQAIFPFYLVHQTIIVVAGHHLDALGLPLAVEAALLLGATGLGCWLFFDLLRRVPALRVWIGLQDAAGRR